MAAFEDRIPVGATCFRVRPVHVRVSGLESEKGRQLNGQRGYIVAKTGGSPCRYAVALGVDAPKDMREIRAAYAAGHMQNLKLSNLLLEPEVAPVVANPSYRSANKHGLLSARAGDVDDALAAAPAERGFFVYSPGARLGVAQSGTHPALWIDPAQLGRWGSAAMAPMPIDAMRARLVEFKRQRGLPADAWDPLHGPGWPGVYTDRRLAGVREAPPEDVLTATSWAEAFELFAQLKEAAPGSAGPCQLALFFAIGADVTVDDVHDFMRWFCSVHLGAEWTSGYDGVGFCGAHVHESGAVRYACVALSIMGGFSPSDVLTNLGADEREPCFVYTLRGVPVRFQCGLPPSAPPPQDASPQAHEKPPHLDWGGLARSADGRFDLKWWWFDEDTRARGLNGRIS